MPDLSSLRLLSDGGRTAAVYLWDEQTVLKLAREPGWEPVFEREAIALEAAAATPGLAPELRGTITIEGRPGLLMERLHGIDLLKELEKKPWRTWHVGRELADVHARLHETAAASEMDRARDGIAFRLRSELVPENIRNRALTLLAEAPEGDRLCHGDFHPGNLMRTTDGFLRVVDFAPACAGDPDWDYASTLTLLQVGQPVGASLWMRGLIRLFRGILVRSYRRRYERLRRVDRANVQRWTAIYLAQRLADGIPEERERLLRMLEKRTASG
ncbi:MAG TPA: aminoglycoside phosphotransferase family protein [Tepidiformaceae bacterium]|nr:aminoglycoside phosphotransferase family protein [Tepidiformaceae bacterium]